MDKDLVIISAYPVAVASHLVYQMLHYPEPKDKIWHTYTPITEVHTPAIEAALRVWIMALAVNLLLYRYVHVSI